MIIKGRSTNTQTEFRIEPFLIETRHGSGIVETIYHDISFNNAGKVEWEEIKFHGYKATKKGKRVKGSSWNPQYPINPDTLEAEVRGWIARGDGK